jgi:hypothetical protein
MNPERVNSENTGSVPCSNPPNRNPSSSRLSLLAFPYKGAPAGELGKSGLGRGQHFVHGQLRDLPDPVLPQDVLRGGGSASATPATQTVES